MTVAIIITLCILLLFAYVFDLTASKTKIPTVVLLLSLGWFVRQVTTYFSILMPDLSIILPAMGTIGLILIVLEGALELELNSSKISLIKKSFVGALIPMLALGFLLAWAITYIGNVSYKIGLMNAIPFCVLSSAIAIPSVRNLNRYNKEFVIYESSLSDILGVLFFNFVVFNESFDVNSIGFFLWQLLAVLIVSIVATLGLSYLLSKINNHVKFIPIILLIILIYEITKIYHLPGLIFILFFGLAIGNLDELSSVRWIKKLNPIGLNVEVKKFRELIHEATFLVRALFFLLFGYLIDTNEVLNIDTLSWTLFILLLIFIFRILQLKLSKLPLLPLVFVAPRGLITILLFLSIEAYNRVSFINKSLITQVIIILALIMMVGIMLNKEKSDMISNNE
jgi:hypothetical protein